MQLAPTPRDVVYANGTARLYRFRRPEGREPNGALPVLLVPSLLNPWYVLDLREGASVCEALVEAGFDTFCLDWGRPEPEDRYLSWADVVERLARFARRVRRVTGAGALGLLGYSMGGTLSGIHAALHPGEVGALVNLAGPFDFSRVGLMGRLTDPRWFDPDAITAPGNVSPLQMLAGFYAVRPTHSIKRLVALLDGGLSPDALDEFFAVEAWAHDNIAVPAAAYATYIRELYQQNQLVRGEHRVAGRRVDLRDYRGPLLTVATDRDDICPLDAARGMHDVCADNERELLVIPGGHVSAVVGKHAPETLYPALTRFFGKALGRPGVAASTGSAAQPVSASG